MTDRPQRSEADLVITLQPGETKHIPRVGSTYQCMTITTDGAVQIGMSQQAQMGHSLYKGVGEILQPGEAPFDYLELLNNAGTVQTVTLQTSMGNIRDNRLNLIGGAVPFDNIPPNTLTTTADTAVVAGSHLDFAADTTRRALIITSLATDGTILRIRDGAADAAAGAPLWPNETITILSTGIVRVFNPGAANVSVAINAMTKV